MSILEVENLTFSYQNEQLFQNANMRLFEGDHAVFVGPNGSGKSTLFKLINRLMKPDVGKITWVPRKKVGYLDQDASLDPNLLVKDYLHTVFKDMFDKEELMEKLYVSVATADPSDYDRILNRAANIGEELEEGGFYALKSRISNVIYGLGLDESVLEQPIKHLSGGMRAKTILAKLLLEEADVLLLDEPTNFLDVMHIEWLSKFLKAYPKTFIVISHHEGFLKEIANTVFALEGTNITRYKGNYEYYLTERQVRFENQSTAFANQQKTIAKAEDFIRRNIVRATTTKRAQSRRKMVDKIVRVSPPEKQKHYKFTFPFAGGTGKEVLVVKDLLIGYDEPLLDAINLEVRRGDKVVITGKNGIGKSTFIKTILEQIKSLGGEFVWISTAKIGYLPQEDHFSESETAFTVLHNAFPDLTVKDVMGELANFGINYEMAHRPLHSLSGGESTKVRIAVMKHKKTNVLVMDEPTNHLDYNAKVALKEALINYKGTLILVSHEKEFYEEVCDYELTLFDE